MQLSRGLGVGESLGRDRDGHEQQPDQCPGHSGARGEEVVNVGWHHRTIFARPTSGGDPEGGRWNTRPFGFTGLICCYR